MARTNLAFADERNAEREEVHYRARAIAADGRTLRLLVVNISAHGLMARCDDRIADGERIRITLPVVGTIACEVRWALGGRAGVQFDRMIELAPYYELLTALVKAG